MRRALSVLMMMPTPLLNWHRHTATEGACFQENAAELPSL